MYARIEGSACAAYPVDLRAEQPNTSFPWDWAGGVISGVEYVRVMPVDVPQVDHTQNFAEGAPALIGNVWTQTWVVTDATPEQVAEREAEARQRMVVSPLQMRRALRQQGHMEAVTAYVALQDADTLDAWEYAIEIRRNDGLIGQAAAALGMTPAQTDDLFRLAASL